MANIPWQQAKNLLVVDPRTGLQIPHVVGADPEKGELTLYLTTYAPIPMIIVGAEANRELDYTFMTITRMDGSRDVMKWVCSCAFDLVDKTGEVIHEVEGRAAPLRATDPSAYCREQQGLPARAPGAGPASPSPGPAA